MPTEARWKHTFDRAAHKYIQSFFLSLSNTQTHTHTHTHTLHTFRPFNHLFDFSVILFIFIFHSVFCKLPFSSSYLYYSSFFFLGEKFFYFQKYISVNVSLTNFLSPFYSNLSMTLACHSVIICSISIPYIVINLYLVALFCFVCSCVCLSFNLIWFILIW